MIPTRTIILAAVCAALTLGAVAGGKSFISHYSAALTEAKIARAQVDSAAARAASALKQAADSRTKANVLDAKLSAAVASAAASERIAQHMRVSFDSVARTAPDTCHVVVEAAHAVMAQQDSTISHLRAGIAVSDSARATLTTALDSTQAALVALRSASISLSHADATLAARSRPSFFARVLPHPGIGAALGFDAMGAPRAVVGITLGWNF